MKNQFVKKYYKEKDTMFYLHVRDSYVVRQIEIEGIQVRKMLEEIDPLDLAEGSIEEDTFSKDAKW